MGDIRKLRTFIQEMTWLVGRADGDEPAILEEGGRLLTDLVRKDDWLPEEFARPHPERYQQYLLHCDPMEKFSVVSFVWGPGQHTPVHDHTVWGMIGILRGGERCRNFDVAKENKPLIATGESHFGPGEVTAVSPRIGDVHEVANTHDDQVSISIHVYGANIGAVRRHVYVAKTGEIKPFVSGYTSPVVPNLWDRSAEVRAVIA